MTQQMALKATIYKAELNITDLDRHYYKTHPLTIAQHPSETIERMMVRIVCFALHASDSLAFTRGLSSDDEPELWQTSLSDEIEIWIDLGQIDEKRIRKASHRAQHVFIYTYDERSATEWWKQISKKIKLYHNVQVIQLKAESADSLNKLVKRNMKLHFTIQDKTIQIADGDENLQFELQPMTDA